MFHYFVEAHDSIKSQNLIKNCRNKKNSKHNISIKDHTNTGNLRKP